MTDESVGACRVLHLPSCGGEKQSTNHQRKRARINHSSKANRKREGLSGKLIASLPLLPSFLSPISLSSLYSRSALPTLRPPPARLLARHPSPQPPEALPPLCATRHLRRIAAPAAASPAMPVMQTVTLPLRAVQAPEAGVPTVARRAVRVAARAHAEAMQGEAARRLCGGAS